MQVYRVTQRRREQRLVIAGSRKNMTQTRIERRDAAIESRVHRLVQNEVRRVADNGRNMIEGDFLRAMRVKHELFKFGARRKPVLAQLGDKKRLGVRRDRQACRANRGIDELRDVLGRVGIALNRRGGSFAFAKCPQGRVFLQRAGFDDDRAVARGRPENRLERGNKRPALRLDPNRPPAAEQRNGIGLVGKARGIIGKRVAADPHKLKRVLRIVDGAAK